MTKQHVWETRNRINNILTELEKQAAEAGRDDISFDRLDPDTWILHLGQTDQHIRRKDHPDTQLEESQITVGTPILDDVIGEKREEFLEQLLERNACMGHVYFAKEQGKFTLNSVHPEVEVTFNSLVSQFVNQYSTHEEHQKPLVQLVKKLKLKILG